MEPQKKLINDKTKYLKNIPLMKYSISNESLEYFEKLPYLFIQKKFKRGIIISEQNKKPKGFYLIKSGTVMLRKLTKIGTASKEESVLFRRNKGYFQNFVILGENEVLCGFELLLDIPSQFEVIINSLEATLLFMKPNQFHNLFLRSKATKKLAAEFLKIKHNRYINQFCSLSSNRKKLMKNPNGSSNFENQVALTILAKKKFKKNLDRKKAVHKKEEDYNKKLLESRNLYTLEPKDKINYKYSLSPKKANRENNLMINMINSQNSTNLATRSKILSQSFCTDRNNQINSAFPNDSGESYVRKKMTSMRLKTDDEKNKLNYLKQKVSRTRKYQNMLFEETKILDTKRIYEASREATNEFRPSRLFRVQSFSVDNKHLLNQSKNINLTERKTGRGNKNLGLSLNRNNFGSTNFEPKMKVTPNKEQDTFTIKNNIQLSNQNKLKRKKSIMAKLFSNGNQSRKRRPAHFELKSELKWEKRNKSKYQ